VGLGYTTFAIVCPIVPVDLDGQWEFTTADHNDYSEFQEKYPDSSSFRRRTSSPLDLLHIPRDQHLMAES